MSELIVHRDIPEVENCTYSQKVEKELSASTIEDRINKVVPVFQQRNDAVNVLLNDALAEGAELKLQETAFSKAHQFINAIDRQIRIMNTQYPKKILKTVTVRFGDKGDRSGIKACDTFHKTAQRIGNRITKLKQKMSEADDQIAEQAVQALDAPDATNPEPLNWERQTESDVDDLIKALSPLVDSNITFHKNAILNGNNADHVHGIHLKRDSETIAVIMLPAFPKRIRPSEPYIASFNDTKNPPETIYLTGGTEGDYGTQREIVTYLSKIINSL